MNRHEALLAPLFSERNSFGNVALFSCRYLDVIGKILRMEIPRLKDKQLQTKIEKILRRAQLSSDSQKYIAEYRHLQEQLQILAQLPTGKILLSCLPEDVVFCADEKLKSGNIRGLFRPSVNKIFFDPDKCDYAAFGHEIRHAIQTDVDIFAPCIHLNPKCLRSHYMPIEHPSYLECELDAAHITWELYEEAHDYLGKQTELSIHQIPYQNLAEKLHSNKTKSIRDTMALIDMWYGLHDNAWRYSYITARGIHANNLGRLTQRAVEGVTADDYKTGPLVHDNSLYRLNFQILNFYLLAHNLQLKPRFFDETKNYTYKEGDTILFTRVTDDKGATIKTFDPNGVLQYEVRIDNTGTRKFKKYVERGLPKIEEQPDETPGKRSEIDMKEIEKRQQGEVEIKYIPKRPPKQMKYFRKKYPCNKKHANSR